MVNFKKISIFLIIIGLFLNSAAQLTETAGLDKAAKNYFNDKDYLNALENYSRLIEMYPQQAEYHYFSGRCIFELRLTERYDEAAVSLELAAVKGKDKKAWFYLGRIYHEKSNYEPAIQAYHRFIERARKKEVRELNAKYFIDFAERELESKDINEMNIAEDRNTPEKKENMNIVNSETKKIHNNMMLSYALRHQLIADSLNRIAKLKRADSKKLDNQAEKKIISADIYRLESASKNNQQKADSIFAIISKSTGDNVINASYGQEEENQFEFKICEEPLNFFVPSKMDLSDSLFYSIQLGIFSKKVNDSLFRKIIPVFFEEVPASGNCKYYAGKFYTFQSVSNSIKKIQKLGFAGVFIVAFYNNERVSVEKAREIEYSQIRF